ncbi:aspartate-semialdehyde dehydrogenase [Candidatus Vidania fulgoroideorum]
MKTAILGSRGMVGKTLCSRIKNKNNFFIFKNKIKGFKNFSKINYTLKCDCIISCKNSQFSKNFYSFLKKNKWKGFYIDASSFFRRNIKSIIVLDPINKNEIIKSIKNGIRIFSGCNCTVSLMLMGLRGILNKFKIKEIYCSTYQSVSGGGYKYFNEFLNQYRNILIKLKNKELTNKIKKITKKINHKITKSVLAFSLSPWIDKNSSNKGETKEEEKGSFEINKILNSNIKVFSTCVRINTLRCHSESIIIKFYKDISEKKFKKFLNIKNVVIVNNKKKDTLQKLNPINVTESENIYIGRIRKIKKKTFSLFLIGDQLIWGAAEPLIRVHKIINELLYKNKILRNKKKI